MHRTRQELEQLEYQILAPYAHKSAESRGRVHPEPPHPRRTDYQRDRDRIIHSRAFRRLEYKTQVFLNGTGDHLRTRLTHTMEMAGISRTIARALRLNEDLTETIALGHDLGHPPFGHSGEDMLDELMKNHGGFDHNLQSLRTVTELEQKYPGFVGLNLTWESREGLSKHHTHDDKPEHLAGFHFHQPSLEAQIADLSDEITYYSHDLDDGLDEGLITLEQLESVRIWQDTFARVKRQHPHLSTDRLRSLSIREIIDGEVADVIAASERNIAAAGVNAPDDARRLAQPLVAHTDDVARANQQLREFLYANLYFNPRVHAPHERAVEVLRDLFEAYVNNPMLMGETARQRITTHGLHRAVCDYLAGMTDRYAFEEHRRVVTSTRVP